MTYGGTTIGTFEGGSGTRFTLTITLNTDATPAAVQELMRNITYRNVSDAPVGVSRMVRFTLSDGDGGLSNPADKFIPVIQVNDAPVNAVPGDQSTNEDTALTFNSGNNNLISISDADAGSNPVQVRLAATNGKLTLNGTSGLTFAPGDSGSADDDMTFTGTIANINSALNGLEFDPDANFSGDATLEITTNDQGNTGSGGALSDADTVSISVNAVNATPVADDDDGGTTDEDTPLEIPAEDLLANDTDVDGDSLSISDFDEVSAQGGTVSLDDGTFTYTPAANYNGPDSFTYKVSDGTEESNVATVSIAVNPANDPPVANIDAYSIDYGQATNTILSVSDSSGVLINDSDPERDSLMAMLASTTSNGQLALNATGSFTYTPRAENFNGQGTFTDSFTYKASDGTAASATAVVRITVGRQCTITGTPNSDSGKATLIGSSGPDVLCGLAGNDTVRGANGDDLIFGDQGQDTLKGEGGDDRVVAKDGSADTLDCGAGNDTVLGFDQGLDKIAKNCENQLPRG